MAVRPAVIGGAWLLVLVGLSAQTPPAEHLRYQDARPVFEALGERVPSVAEWPTWITASDRATRARVAEGDETSIVNWLLFGAWFTKEPRITSRQLDAGLIIATVNARLTDFERAFSEPGNNERLQHARQVLGTGIPIRARLLSMLDRALNEQQTHARIADDARRLGDPNLEFAERSRMYRARGLSSDTSVRINFAVEDALRRLTPALGAVRRVGIIGPGLDFSDKQEGHDFYPVQTIQPFALQDSLIRLGLAAPDSLTIATFDVSARVNAHLAEAGRLARQGSPYVVHLPLDGDVLWTPGFLEYWRRFGEGIGSAVPVTIPPQAGSMRLRAVSVRPSYVLPISAIDMNITAQRLALADAERFDLIIGTNVFVYYDRLQQGLAMASAAGMLRPGGILLSNNALVEVPSSTIRAIGYSKTLYSKREEDGDLIIWYQKGAR